MDRAATTPPCCCCPGVGFLPSSDPRVRNTVEAVRNALCTNGFVLRCRTKSGVDGFLGGEGAFLVGSFWFADALSGIGRVVEATTMVQRLLELHNDVGYSARSTTPRPLASNGPSGLLPAPANK